MELDGTDSLSLLECCRYRKALPELTVCRKLTGLRTLKIWLLHQGSQSPQKVTAKGPCLP